MCVFLYAFVYLLTFEFVFLCEYTCICVLLCVHVICLHFCACICVCVHATVHFCVCADVCIMGVYVYVCLVFVFLCWCVPMHVSFAQWRPEDGEVVMWEEAAHGAPSASPEREQGRPCSGSLSAGTKASCWPPVSSEGRAQPGLPASHRPSRWPH